MSPIKYRQKQATVAISVRHGIAQNDAGYLRDHEKLIRGELDSMRLQFFVDS